jgi:hypothetical protein
MQPELPNASDTMGERIARDRCESAGLFVLSGCVLRLAAILISEAKATSSVILLIPDNGHELCRQIAIVVHRPRSGYRFVQPIVFPEPFFPHKV